MNIGEKKEMICINCPIGCQLIAEKTADGFKVTGNTCPRGEKYAIAELTHPTRTLTTTVKVANREGVYHRAGRYRFCRNLRRIRHNSNRFGKII